MSDRVVNLPNFPPATEAEIEAPVSVEELKAAWPYCREMGVQKQTGYIPKSPSLPVAVRGAILHQLFKIEEPTDEQFAVMAEMPLDGSVDKEEIGKRLGLGGH